MAPRSSLKRSHVIVCGCPNYAIWNKRNVFARHMSLGAAGGSGSRPIETHRPHKRFSTPVVSLPVCMLSGVWRKSETIHVLFMEKEVQIPVYR